MNLKQISVIIIVKNAEQTLLECLNSLKGFDEIILLNNESSDNTLKIANEFKKDFANLHIYHSAFIGFGALKNLALSYAKNDWILSIDADEVLENECIKELKNLELQEDNIITLSRKNLYKGEWIKACGWWPDYVLRIFNKNFTRFNDNLVHESLILPSNAKKIHLKNGLKHYACNGIESIIYKMNLYTSFSAKEKLKKGKKASIFGAISRFWLIFIKDYFFRGGVKYGYKGFVIALLNANGAFFRYMKLYELNHGKN
ncbi:TPA: glycosyltransferase family 2 protein [Campylobacter jejuni]|uniref:Putative glucosyltransferase n=1 Tax=Campylobacter jejuni TaxID=197 RepID=A3EYU3_CAMJU|nr:putative glucosyltransferase [Campylobacter jejuni]AIW10333.1 glycosyltransferase [Campylobacter jejuni subsp. jejuni F38011]KQI03300.1 glycosyltransferase [Campylobacter jejuni CVM 41927]OEW47181.1 glycosyltransferase [Campylobacter sp. BCW_6466]PKD37602.1 glycosyltransferase family 2 protein [Campylobacter jejuni subsp. jejuni]HEB7588802.1 glycosyltransferase family 2 protein [Campylobacter coli]